MFDLCSVSEAGFTLKAVFIGCFIDSCRKIVDFSESKCVEGSQGRLRGGYRRFIALIFFLLCLLRK